MPAAVCLGQVTDGGEYLLVRRYTDLAPDLELRPVRVQEALHLLLGRGLNPGRGRGHLHQVPARILLQGCYEDALARLQQLQAPARHLTYERGLAGPGETGPYRPLAAVQPDLRALRVNRESVERAHVRPVLREHIRRR